MKRHSPAALCLTALALLTQTSSGSLINGDFETPEVDFQFYGTGAGPTPWTIGTAMYLIDQTDSSGGSNDLAQSGSQYMMYAGNTSGLAQLSQSISGLSLGVTYTVSYYVSAIAFRTFGQTVWGSYSVAGSMGGGSNLYNASLPDPGVDNIVGAGSVGSPWVQRSFQFTAASTSEILTFDFTGHNGIATSGSYPAIDNVTLVPEPSSILLGTFGLVALVARRRRSPLKAQ